MYQCCNVYINILCDETDKLTISEWLKSYFKDTKNCSIWTIPTDRKSVV